MKDISRMSSRFYQSGQTLIETLVGAFVMVMGISAAVGLAVYAFGASSNVTKQIVATGLARQGIESVKNMRDTNWLKLTINNTCYNFQDGLNDAYCYINWLNNGGLWNNQNSPDRGYNIDPGASPASYGLLSPDYDVTNKTWDWKNAVGTNTKFGLNFYPDVTVGSFEGFYQTLSPGTLFSNSGFYQQIIVTDDTTTAPYSDSAVNSTLGPLLKVQSRVWWNDKHCTSTTSYDSASPACRVEAVDYLTNWKDYQ